MLSSIGLLALLEESLRIQLQKNADFRFIKGLTKIYDSKLKKKKNYNKYIKSIRTYFLDPSSINLTTS
jgi:hypothetical protein